MDIQNDSPFSSGTPITAGAATSLIYEPFYGLREKPFSLSADPRFWFRSLSHGAAFDDLYTGIRRREGLIVLTGEIGTGKTTLCRSVLKQLDGRTFAAFVADPFVSREDLLKTLLLDFGVVSMNDLAGGRFAKATRSDLSYLLYEFLDSLAPLHAFAVVVIDEAQHLSLGLLEEIRILSELERREKMLQVVLVGQPELRASLKLPQMRQVDHRISVRCELTPLDAAGVADYVKHRIHIAGYGAARLTFESAALDAVFTGSAGVPRLINRICDRALQRSHAARSRSIYARYVWQAIDDLGLDAAGPAAVSFIAPAAETIAPAAETAAPRAAGSLQVVPKPEAVPSIASAAVETAASFRHATPDSAGDEHRPAADASLSHTAPRPRPYRPIAKPAGRRRLWIGPTLAAVVAGVAGAGYVVYAQRETNALAAFAAVVPPLPPAASFASTMTPPPAAAEASEIAGDFASTQADMSAASAPSAAPDASTPAVVTASVKTATAAPPAQTPASDAQNADEGQFSILVASFKTRERADQVVAELTGAGYHARAVEHDWGPPRGRLVHVSVGGYASAIDVERDLQRIRDLPGGYHDARILDRQ